MTEACILELIKQTYIQAATPGSPTPEEVAAGIDRFQDEVCNLAPADRTPELTQEQMDILLDVTPITAAATLADPIEEPGTFAEEVLRQALAQDGTGEDLGRNRGRMVNQFLEASNNSPGEPWCMAFVQWCIAEAAKEFGVKNPCKENNVVTGHVMTFWGGTKPLGWRVTNPADARPGDIMIIEHGGGTGHTGFVVSPPAGGKVETIEGNTNLAGSREGTAVLRKSRPLAHIKGFVRLPDVDLAAGGGQAPDTNLDPAAAPPAGVGGGLTFSVAPRPGAGPGPGDFVARFGGRVVRRHNNALHWLAGMMIDADGAPTAYAPNSADGLDALGNAGGHGNWWGVVTDNGEKNGNPVTHIVGGKTYYVSATSLIDSTFDRTDPRRYVDASTVPFIVVPGPLVRAGVVRPGDFAVALNTANGLGCLAIVADSGPKDKIGEGSIALAKALGIRSDPRKGGTDAPIVRYLAFPGSGNKKARPLDEIRDEAGRLLAAWGGPNALRDLG